MSFLFVTGGCRSGKSAYAQREAEKFINGGQGIYIATAYVIDNEMRERVKRHQDARGPEWRTHECGFGSEAELHLALPDIGKDADVILLDSLTLWVSGWMEACSGAQQEDFLADCEKLLLALRALPCPVVVVSDETGMGLVPENGEARLFRDLLGLANQKVAAFADSCVFMISGLPLYLKKGSFGAN